MAQRLIVIGGDAAGMSAASQARRRRDRGDLEIVVFERGHFTSYSACGIPYWISGLVPGPDALIARDPETFRTEYAMDVRMRHEVTAIDLERREVVARDLEGGGEVRERFDDLMYATGAVPVKPPWAVTDAGGVFGMQTLDDGAALRDWLDADPQPRRAVVVGGGYIGVEIAEALIQRGLSVTLVEAGEQPMATVDADMGELVAEAMRGLGITIRDRPAGDRPGASGTAGCPRWSPPRGRSRPTSWSWASAYAPTPRSPRPPGCPLGPTGAIRVDRRMRVPGLPGVWAAGDCVETLHRVSGMPVHVPLGTHANKQGRVAGINIGGGYATFAGVIGTAVTKVCDLEVGRTGLRERRGHGGRLRVRLGDRRVDQPGRLLPGCPADDGQADRRASQRPVARRADRRLVRGGQTDRHAGRGAVERHDGGRYDVSWTWATLRRTRRCGIRCSSPPEKRSTRSPPSTADPRPPWRTTP